MIDSLVVAGFAACWCFSFFWGRCAAPFWSCFGVDGVLSSSCEFGRVWQTLLIFAHPHSPACCVFLTSLERGPSYRLLRVYDLYSRILSRHAHLSIAIPATIKKMLSRSYFEEKYVLKVTSVSMIYNGGQIMTGQNLIVDG